MTQALDKVTADELSVGASDGASRNRRRLRFELIFGSVWLGVGLFVLPAVIFAVGVTLLGPYREGSGLGRFYVDFFGDLAEPSGRAWTIALGPLFLISFLRAVFIGVSKPDPSGDFRHDSRNDAPQKPSTRTRSEASRVEPSVSPD